MPSTFPSAPPPRSGGGSSTVSMRALPTSRRHRVYRCRDCAAESPRWLGRCPQCHAWDTVEEARQPHSDFRRAAGSPGRPGTGLAVSIAQVSGEATAPRPTGLAELDRVLGGGLVPGGVVLLAGEPGVGKSTLLLEVASRRAAAGDRVLYVTGEESGEQVSRRAERTATRHPDLFLLATTDVEVLAAAVAQVNPHLLVVDSVQTVSTDRVEGGTGGVAQVREVATFLAQLARSRQMSCVLVGQVTKDGAVAGPRHLEHLVDVVASFEGDPHGTFRLLRATKNRFGPADEIGCFEMTATGLAQVPDPSGLFATPVVAGVVPPAGTVATVTRDGRRALAAEVQALVGVSASERAGARRIVNGLDAGRVAMVLAVLERRAGVRLGSADVYAATLGGARVTEPGADLAIALAVASAAGDLPMPPETVVIGEVGLTGELRTVPGMAQRLAEAARLGFRQAIVPAGWRGASGSDAATSTDHPLRCRAVTDLAAARALLGAPRPSRRPPVVPLD